MRLACRCNTPAQKVKHWHETPSMVGMVAQHICHLSTSLVVHCWSSAVPPCPAESGSLCGSWEEGGGAACGAVAASMGPLLAGLSKAGVAWADKVALFQSVEAALLQSGASQHLAADVASNTDRLVAALLEGVGDAHFRVAAAALAALAAGLASPCCRLFEPQLDRVMTALFARCGTLQCSGGRASGGKA